MPSPAKVSRQSSRWKLVLCIDDDKNALHPRKLVLEAAGDDMTTATSDRITLRLLKRLITKGHPPAVLLRCLNLLSEGVAIKRPQGKVNPRDQAHASSPFPSSYFPARSAYPKTPRRPWMRMPDQPHERVALQTPVQKFVLVLLSLLLVSLVGCTLASSNTQQLPSPTQHTATLTWTPDTSTVAGYNVYRGTVSSGPYTQINTVLDAATNYVDNTVQSGQTYYYVATAVSTAGVESAYSNQVTAVVPSP